MKSDRDWLEDALEASPYIDDAGFTDEVLRALPSRRAPSRARFFLVPSFGAIGCVAAWEATSGWGSLVLRAVREVQTGGHVGTTAALAVTATAAILVAGAFTAARGVA